MRLHPNPTTSLRTISLTPLRAAHCGRSSVFESLSQVGEKGDHVSVKFPEDNPHAAVNVAQNIALRRGDLFLYIAIWDTATGRMGTLQIPYNVK